MVLEQPLRMCRALYNCALEQRCTWWGRGQGRAATHAQQEAALPELKAAFAEYQQVHSQVLHDVLVRLDQAFQSFFRRLAAGDQPGHARFQGLDRYHSLLDNVRLVLTKIGRLTVRWSSPLQGRPKTVTLARSRGVVRLRLLFGRADSALGPLRQRDGD